MVTGNDDVIVAEPEEQVSSRGAIAQLQNTLSTSVYRWKFKALSDWSNELADVIQLTNRAIGDVMHKLLKRYPSAARIFNPQDFVVCNFNIVSSLKLIRKCFILGVEQRRSVAAALSFDGGV